MKILYHLTISALHLAFTPFSYFSNHYSLLILFLLGIWCTVVHTSSQKRSSRKSESKKRPFLAVGRCGSLSGSRFSSWKSGNVTRPRIRTLELSNVLESHTFMTLGLRQRWAHLLPNERFHSHCSETQKKGEREAHHHFSRNWRKKTKFMINRQFHSHRPNFFSDPFSSVTEVGHAKWIVDRLFFPLLIGGRKWRETGRDMSKMSRHFFIFFSLKGKSSRTGSNFSHGTFAFIFVSVIVKV